MQLNKTVAFITGGASGLGEATVRMIVASGGKAAIADLAEQQGKALEEELGASVIYVKTDVCDEQSVLTALERTTAAFGTINLVVNCAGLYTIKKLLGRKGVHPLDRFEQIVRVNLIGTFNVIRLASDQMSRSMADEEGERGVIVNTASVAGLEGQIGHASYGASKGGVLSLTLPLARELADYGIRVVSISPGLFETPMMNMAKMNEEDKTHLREIVPFPSRLGRPSEFAHTVKYVCENSMINGCNIRLDGAIRLPMNV